MFSLEQIEQEVIDSLKNDVFPGQDVYEEAVPDNLEMVRRPVSGQLIPYVTIQVEDTQPWGSRSFMGPMGDDYVLPVRYQVIAPTPEIGRQLRSFALQRFLGLSFDWAGQIRKRVSGGSLTMKNSDGAVECYIYPASFGIVVQLAEIPDP